MAKQFQTDIDLTGNQLRNARMQNAATIAAPANPTSGQVYWDTDRGVLRVHDGQGWRDVPHYVGGDAAYLTGNRTGIITVTHSVGISDDDPANLVNGNLDNTYDLFNNTAAGLWIQFELNVAQPFSEVRLNADRAWVNGNWQVQGSQDGAAWTNLTAAFPWTHGAAGFLDVALAGNTTAWRFYRLLGVSGNASNAAWFREVDFTMSTGFAGS